MSYRWQQNVEQLKKSIFFETRQFKSHIWTYLEIKCFNKLSYLSKNHMEESWMEV
jgi:hypothetical protein